ncbi:hypothetical protein C8Q79DRAFT_291464 [Trametes meyenii]|nr:hypothetical protein C8Q79DRAFT_291464 [Trametes meyenii]
MTNPFIQDSTTSTPCDKGPSSSQPPQQQQQSWQHNMIQRQLGVAERGELRAYNKDTTRWRPMPLPDGEPYPANLPFKFPDSVFALGEMPLQHVRQLASLYGVHDPDMEHKLRDNLAIFIASHRV